MKNVFLACILFLFAALANAQQDFTQKELAGKPQKGILPQKGLSSIPKCFCCDNAYNLPVPGIIGPKSVKCGDTARFTTSDCPGAKYSWSVSPQANFKVSGNGITIYPPLNPGTYTITLQLSCGKAVVSNTFAFTVEKPLSCNPSFTFTYTLLSNGLININTVPDPSTQIPGTEHWWGIKGNGNLPNCNTCEAIEFSDFNSSATGVWGGYINSSGILTPYKGTGITKGTSGFGINYSGNPNNSCIKITHYIKCCGVLYRQTQCASFSTVNGKLAKPVIIRSNVEQVGITNLQQ